MDQIALEIIASVVGPNKAVLEIVAMVFDAHIKSFRRLVCLKIEPKVLIRVTSDLAMYRNE